MKFAQQKIDHCSTEIIYSFLVCDALVLDVFSSSFKQSKKKTKYDMFSIDMTTFNWNGSSHSQCFIRFTTLNFTEQIIKRSIYFHKNKTKFISRKKTHSSCQVVLLLYVQQILMQLNCVLVCMKIMYFQTSIKYWISKKFESKSQMNSKLQY